MSAFGPKQTSHYVAFDVAIGGKADIAGLSLAGLKPAGPGNV
jgi:hypothetical protein